MKPKSFFYFLYFCFAKRMPKSYSKVSFFSRKIRYCLAKKFCRYVGKNVNFEKGAIFSSSLSVGDNSGIGINSSLQGRITIGNNVMMGPEVWIYTRNHKHDSIDIPMIEQGFEEEKEVTICDDVWIGSRVTILPGITIGKGAIIGAGSVVTKNVSDYTIVAGNPARVVKIRTNNNGEKQDE